LERGGSCLSVGDKQYEMLRYVCVMLGDVFEVSSRQVLCVGGVVFIWRGGGCAVMHAVGPSYAACLRWPVLSSVGLVGSS